MTTSGAIRNDKFGIMTTLDYQRLYELSVKYGECTALSKGTFTHARADAGGKLASTQIITCVHTCAVAERRRSGCKNRSARNGSNTQFTAPASKPRAPNHHCPQEMADPPASAPGMCEHTRGNRAGISKSARLRSATAPRMCERSLSDRSTLCIVCLVRCDPDVFYSVLATRPHCGHEVTYGHVLMRHSNTGDKWTHCVTPFNSLAPGRSR